MFSDDVLASEQELRTRLEGRRILVIGGAGSIGMSTLHALSRYRPNTLHVVDQNENNLAELVRDLRSAPTDFEVKDFRTVPIDFGSNVMLQFLRHSAPYDYVLNFAALKHVRSEKDMFSLIQMFDTNVVKHARLLRWLQEDGRAGHYFSVSTDKAANPVSLMGASKRIMEHVMFSGAIGGDSGIEATSARFANVAYSDGSLLLGLLNRISKPALCSSGRGSEVFHKST